MRRLRRWDRGPGTGGDGEGLSYAFIDKRDGAELRMSTTRERFIHASGLGWASGSESSSRRRGGWDSTQLFCEKV